MRAFPFRLSVWFVAAWASAASGCADYKPASDTLLPSTASNTAGPDWSCLQLPAERTPPIGSVGDFVVYSVRVVDLVSADLTPEVTLKACALADTQCTNPVTSDLKPGADGWVNLPVRNTFQGYLQITSPEAMPQLFHLPDTGLRTMRDFPIVTISKQVYDGLVQTLQLMDDPGLGAIAVRTFDCRNELAAGVTLRSDIFGVPWYFQDGAPTTMLEQTDLQGLGGFVGIAPGFAVSEATLPDGREITSQKLIVRPGWMSTGFLRPPRAIAQP